MAENKDGQEKTEEPTAKRLADAREKGQVSKSQDMTTAGVLFLGGLSVFALGSPLVRKFQAFLANSLSTSAQFSFTETNLIRYIKELIIFLGELLLPIMLVVVAIVLIGEISQVGLKLSLKRFTDPQSLSKPFKLLSGLKRVFFSAHSVVELIKGILKILLLGGVSFFVIKSHIDEISTISEKPFFEVTNLMTSMALEIILKVAGLYIVIAVADFIFQKWKFKQDMKMTKQELKEEMKQLEGDQHVKSRLRALGRNMLRQKMIQNVNKADVVITNPTHFAVALMYKQGEHNAPIVVAKGVDFLAMKIKDVANENNIPIVEDPPLARTLFKLVEVDQEIPETLFKTVAQVLAYIYQLKTGQYVFYKQSTIDEVDK
ncbi:MAG: flagellar biosynthesis protein FlhB [Ignavibacteria bacterium]|jgi:flagellar biosynthetic protein FlhB|nr:flagellar biosynthesis protein FlhB [Ignavibacteria bacterium]